MHMPQSVGEITRDAPIAIFLADSDFFWEVWPADNDFLSKNYNWQHIQTET